MHELHLIQQLFDDLLAMGNSLGAKKITKIYLRMGSFTEINPEVLRFFFKEKSKGTILEEAELEIESSSNRELRLLSFDYE
ncbi:MAG: Hydrogenase/urease nickel incorporation, metallochaperone, hypA [Candidatus Atribacteria bacterium]|nr:Hydrogenase/urease nickel incorporation, metallochaperone, hypA [Candidatus Atribacteria bacterium]